MYLICKYDINLIKESLGISTISIHLYIYVYAFIYFFLLKNLC